MRHVSYEVRLLRGKVPASYGVFLSRCSNTWIGPSFFIAIFIAIIDYK